MNKKKQLDELRASMQAIAGMNAIEQLVINDDQGLERTRRRSEIKDEIKDENDSIKKSKSKLSFTTQELPPEELARQYALDCLSRREYGTQELLNKMLGKDHEHSISTQVLKELTEEDLLSDERFAEAMVSHGAFKGQDKAKQMRFMQTRGFEIEHINASFGE